MNQSDEKTAINKHLSEKLLKFTTNVNFFLVSNDTEKLAINIYLNFAYEVTFFVCITFSKCH